MPQEDVGGGGAQILKRPWEVEEEGVGDRRRCLESLRTSQRSRGQPLPPSAPTNRQKEHPATRSRRWGGVEDGQMEGEQPNTQ